ncbi:hypothetical protein XACJK48_6140008 [Xanthomonas citri pv. citri]|nr:hypothetical protein XACLE3_5780010 [Xanthomonas citri pv. citri]CEH49014.1 hypothetical protein XACJK48_6140008 [Xanthomonas citri pv. citri]CEH82445.1 hypothetical protein XACS582_9220007 [Xanthomonas citri pv. citri]CEL45919.1 hypothetical protein XAC439_8140008 [Xanthomonas citri pv. citri]
MRLSHISEYVGTSTHAAQRDRRRAVLLHDRKQQSAIRPAAHPHVALAYYPRPRRPRRPAYAASSSG